MNFKMISTRMCNLFKIGFGYSRHNLIYHGPWIDPGKKVGFAFGLAWGKVLGPIPSGKPSWKEGKCWFVLKLPWFIGPYIVFSFRKSNGKYWGFYLGLRTWGIDRTDDHYESWLPVDENEEWWPPEYGEEYRYLYPDARIYTDHEVK